jgi:hypothetical protein
MSSFKHSKKHGSDEQPNAAIKIEIEKTGKNNELPCALAFKIAESLGVSPAEVGKTADLIGFELVKCQLGLFGYRPDKKIVKPKETAPQALKDAISAALVNGRLPCKSAWDIAGRFDVPKMNLSGVCEAMNIKIKPCQLGAF